MSTTESAASEVIVDRPIPGVARLLLNRPQHMNTMTPGMLEEVLFNLEEIADDPTCKVLVLSGVGRAFCAGGDLSRGAGGRVSGEPPVSRQTGRLRRFMRTSELLREMPQVTIAAINGACAGAGLAWACAADIRISADTARFATGFRNAGLSGDFGGTWLLPRIVGEGIARELYLRANPISAERAYQLGLVSEVVITDQQDVVAKALEIAEEITRSAPLAPSAIKANLNDAAHVDFSTALDREAARHTALAATADATEAAAAFVAKRPPVWQGS